MGVMYANGRGAQRDYIEAYKWLNIAGAQGNEKAIKARDAVARRMSSAQVETAQNLAREAVALGLGATVTGEIPARLRNMTQRELVSEAQGLLNLRGHNVGSADGIMGPRTRTAVREFERQAGLPVTGVVTRALVLRITSDGRESRRPTIDHRSTALAAPLRAAPSVPAPTRRRVAPATECDRLAAHPSSSIDAAGIVFARIDAPRAIPARARGRPLP